MRIRVEGPIAERIKMLAARRSRKLGRKVSAAEIVASLLGPAVAERLKEAA